MPNAHVSDVLTNAGQRELQAPEAGECTHRRAWI